MTADMRHQLDAVLAKIEEAAAPLAELEALDAEIAALEREVEAAGQAVGPRAVVVERLREAKEKDREREILGAARESIEAAVIDQAGAADALEDSTRRLAAEVVDAEVAAVQKRVAEFGQRILAEAARLEALRQVADASILDSRFAPVSVTACGVAVETPTADPKERDRLRAAIGDVVEAARRAGALAERIRELGRERWQRVRREERDRGGRAA